MRTTYNIGCEKFLHIKMEKEIAYFDENDRLVKTTREVEERGNFKNITAISNPDQTKIVGPKRVYDVETPKTSPSRETTMYTSYVKDLVVSGKTIEEAIELVKQARDSFS